MYRKILIGVGISIALSYPTSARETNWSWLFIFPPSHAAKPAWSTDQGIAKDESGASRIDIRIGGEAAASPTALDLYQLRGSIRGETVTTTLTGLDTDERGSRYKGKLITTPDGDHISLTGPDGSAILLYAAAETPLSCISSVVRSIHPGASLAPLDSHVVLDRAPNLDPSIKRGLASQMRFFELSYMDGTRRLSWKISIGGKKAGGYTLGIVGLDRTNISRNATTNPLYGAFDQLSSTCNVEYLGDMPVR